jgi:hypothetical protein
MINNPTTTPDEGSNLRPFTERARAVMLSFAAHAEALAEAAHRASKGTETAEDIALLGNAWEESGRYSGRARGLLIEQDTYETHVWEVMKHLLFPEPEESTEQSSSQAWEDHLHGMVEDACEFFGE